MRKTIVVACMFVCFFLFTVMASQTYGDSAEVLPKGVFKANVITNLYIPIDKRYNPDGDTEDVAIDFNTNLNNAVFTDLGLVESAFVMAPGSASIGRSDVSFEYKFTELFFSLMYGVTDKLTVGVYIPYYFNKTDVKRARLDASTATVGKSAIGAGLGAPLVPLAGGGPFGDAVPLITEDVQDLLGRGLDVNGDGIRDIDGFGYKRFETWSEDGIGDIEVGLRYQYLKTDNWRLAFTGGVRLPTGEVDDPDNLIDYGFGSGAYAVLFRLNNDYTGIKNLLLNATFRYDLILPDRELRRVPDDVNRPITLNKENVRRDLGDILEMETSGEYEFLKGLSLSLLYKYGRKQKNHISGEKRLAYESLEEESNFTYNIFITGLSYSTIPLFKEKKFPLPLNASFAYENHFAGSNNHLKQQIFTVSLAVFF